MKTLLSFFLFLLCHFYGNCKTGIEFKASNRSNVYVRIDWPVNGTYFKDNFKILPVIKGIGQLLPYNSEQPGLVILTWGARKYMLFVEPGKYQKIDIDSVSGTEVAHFQGANKEGQVLLNSFKRSSAENFFKETATGTDWRIIPGLIDSSRLLETTLIRKLYASRSIDYDFYQYLLNDVQIYYDYLITYLYANIYFNLDGYTTKFVYSNQIQRSELIDRWKGQNRKLMMDDSKKTAVPYFYDLIEIYCQLYTANVLKKENGDSITVLTPKNQYIEGYNNLSGLSPKIRSYAEARFISDLKIENKFEPQLLTLYKSFLLFNPDSQYLPKFKIAHKELMEYLRKIEQPYTSQQKFLEGYSKIGSVTELLSTFDKGIVFIDIWATWCKPCLAEFAQNQKLKIFAKENEITMLFISIDNEQADELWQDGIKTYDLEGINMRTSLSLYRDLQRTFAGNEGLTIPRYLIIKNGKIMEKNAFRPSDGDLLLKQLAIYCNNRD